MGERCWLWIRFTIKLKNYIIENKEDILIKASEIPSVVFEAIDEIRSFSKNKNASNQRIIELENQLSKQKYINRAIAVAIIVSITIIFIVS